MKWMLLVLAGLLSLAALSAWGRWQIEREFPPVGKMIEVDGQRLHVLDQGEGPALILVHGASSNLNDFAASILPELAKTHRVLAFDRPGYGYSERGDDAWPDPQRLADLLLTAAEQMGAEQPVMLGHSWAGSVVMSALVHYPERLRAGVLLSGVAGHWAGSVDWTYDLGSLPVIGPLFAHTLVYPAGTRLLPSAVATVLAPNPVPEGYVERIAAPLALRANSFLHNVQDMRRLSEYMQALSPRYREIQLPLLVIHGEADELVPYWNHGQRLEPVIASLQVAMLSGVGHAPHHAAPDAVIGALRGFLAELP